MAILPLRRINVVGPVDMKREALAELQKLGCVHLISSVLPTTDDDQPAAPDEGQDAREALRYLSDCQARRRQAREDLVTFLLGLAAMPLAYLIGSQLPAWIPVGIGILESYGMV